MCDGARRGAKMAAGDAVWDVAIVGGGPAGVQCAIWCAQFGLSTALFERSALGGLQAVSPYANSWLASSPPDGAASDVASALARSLHARQVAIVKEAVDAIERVEQGAFVLTFGRSSAAATRVAIASGTRPNDGGFAQGRDVAIGLADLGRRTVSGLRVAVLGGADAAAEAYATCRAGGAASVRIFARRWRARRDLSAAVAPEDVVLAPNVALSEGGVRAGGARWPIDLAVVCYGWRPTAPDIRGAPPRRDADGFFETDARMRTTTPGLYAIGDVRAGPLRCVATAMADGAIAADAVRRDLESALDGAPEDGARPT